MKTFLLRMLLLVAYVGWLPVYAMSQMTINSEENNPVIMYGGLITVDDNKPVEGYGIYSFPVDDENMATFSKVVTGEEMLIYDGVYVDGKYYAATTFRPYNGPVQHFVFRQYDTKDWSETMEEWYLDGQMSLLAYDVTEDKFYGVYYITVYYDDGSLPTTKYTLVNLNIQEKTTYVMGDLSVLPISMTFDDKGQLFLIGKEEGNSQGQLYKVNKESAVITKIGDTGVYLSDLPTGFLYDDKQDRFYWSASLISSSGLYEIDIASGKATLLTSFGKKELFSGLFFPDNISEDAPGEAENLKFIPSVPGGLRGKVSFRVPEKTVSGKSLSPYVSATLWIGDQLPVLISQLSPGEIYEEEVTLKKTGYNFIRLIHFNEAGSGKLTTNKFWAGLDSPDGVKNLTLSADEASNPFLEWDNPGEIGEHGGYVNVADITYNIIRLPDSTKVISSLKEITYSDKIDEDEMKKYSYIVTPYISGIAGPSAESNQLIFGSPFTVPFKEEFTKERFEVWSIYDANQDGISWYYDPIENMTRSGMSLEKVADDWLFSPPITLEAGTVYKLSYCVTAFNAYKPANFKVTYGKTPSPDSHQILSDYPEFLHTEDFIGEDMITIPTGESGLYYIGFYDYTAPTNPGVLLKTVNIDLAYSPGVPGAVVDVKTSYTGEGNAPAHLTFLAPSLNAGGEELADIERIEIYRNDEGTPAHIFTSVVKGKSYTWSDADVKSGKNYYKIIPVNSLGYGVEVNDSVYIGVDLPGKVENLLLKRTAEGKGELSWLPPVEGINKGYIKQTVYQIVRNDGAILEKNYVETTYTDNTLSEENQEFYYYSITPLYPESTDMGVSENSNTELLGKAYNLPFEESFPNSQYNNGGWTQEILTGEKLGWLLGSSLEILDCAPQDNDKGMAVFDGYTLSRGDGIRLISPLLDFTSIEEPILRFWLYHTYEESGAYLLPSISINNGEFKVLDIDTIYSYKNSNSTAAQKGWQFYEFSLSPFKGQQNVRIGFDAVTKFTNGFSMALDNISVIEKPDKDIKIISFDVPNRLFAGYKNSLNLTLRNSGVNSTSDYKINLYQGEELKASLKGTNIDTGEILDLNLETIFDIAEIGKKITVRAEVIYEGDKYPNDNVAESSLITIQRSVYSSVVNMQAGYGDGKIILDWTAPLNPKTPVLVEEGFETYDSFTISEIGEWTLVDNDEMETLNLVGNLFTTPYLNAGAPMAYQVFETAKASPVGEDWNPYSGNKMLASFVTVAGSNDDWLISPELNGSSQEVTFFARGIDGVSANSERFVFHVSYEGKELSDFDKVNSGSFVTVPGRWTAYRFTLPEESRYFAIQCVSDRALTLLLDDICFAKGDDAISPIGYNVYRNGNRLNNEILEVNYFEEPAPLEGEIYTYVVTAVYEDGESNYSESKSFDFTGIVKEEVTPVTIYSTPNGIQIDNAYNLLIEVISIDGTVVYKTLGKEINKVYLESGLYIVKVGDHIEKSVVK